ncbi:hypothetical protein IAU60_005383 [Kwoniella sp. DSM 27419]
MTESSNRVANETEVEAVRQRFKSFMQELGNDKSLVDDLMPSLHSVAHAFFEQDVQTALESMKGSVASLKGQAAKGLPQPYYHKLEDEPGWSSEIQTSAANVSQMTAKKWLSSAVSNFSRGLLPHSHDNPWETCANGLLARWQERRSVEENKEVWDQISKEEMGPIMRSHYQRHFGGEQESEETLDAAWGIFAADLNLRSATSAGQQTE